MDIDTHHGAVSKITHFFANYHTTFALCDFI